MKNLKIVSLCTSICLLLAGCFLFTDKTVAAPLSVTVTNPSHWIAGPTLVYDPGAALVAWTIDASGTVYPSFGDVYYNTANDFATATLSSNHPAGSATVTGLTPGQTYYFWVVSYGEWAGLYYYSQPTGPASPPLPVQ